MNPLDETRKAMEACVQHAKDLLASARVVKESGHPNIAYHLAVLSLEELGRRELIGMQHVAKLHGMPVSGRREKQAQDHVKKLFWCFFGAQLFTEGITPAAFASANALAKKLHLRRKEGLYVDQGEDGLAIPSNVIGDDDCQTIIDLAEARLGIALSSEMREDVSPEELQIQQWFVRAAADEEQSRRLFSKASLEKLAELKSAAEWMKWIKTEFDRDAGECLAMAKKEMDRSRALPLSGSRDKWRMKIRIYSGSHVVRPKALNQWNDKVGWIKLQAVPDKRSHNQLVIEFVFRDDMPIHAVFDAGLGLSRRLLVALNIGTMGYWWWRLPEQVSRYYESIDDLEQKAGLLLERNPPLKIDWGPNRVLTAEDLGTVSTCLAAMPPSLDGSPFHDYLGGLTFLSLNDIHWQCEKVAFHHFVRCLKGMMEATGALGPDVSFDDAVAAFLEDVLTTLDEDAKRFKALVLGAMSGDETMAVTLKDVSFAKAFCDGYFLREFRSRALGADGVAEEVTDAGLDEGTTAGTNSAGKSTISR